MPFEEDLLAFLGGRKMLLLVGVGSTVRKDDAAGIKVVSLLRGRVPKGVQLMDTGTTPENYSSPIKRLDPSHIIFFDAVEMGEQPGVFAFLDEGDLAIQSVSTHKQSIKILFSVLRDGLPGARIRLVGIQPKNIDFGASLSSPVKRGVDSLVKILINALGEKCDENH